MRLDQRTFSFSSEATNPTRRKASFSISMIIDDNWSVSLEGVGELVWYIPYPHSFIFLPHFSLVTPNHSQCVFLSVANICVLMVGRSNEDDDEAGYPSPDGPAIHKGWWFKAREVSSDTHSFILRIHLAWFQASGFYSLNLSRSVHFKFTKDDYSNVFIAFLQS